MVDHEARGALSRIRLGLLLLAAVVLTACGAAEPTWAPDAEVSRSVYQHDGPTAITLFTVVGAKRGTGAHSGLLINAPSQRAMFDPAGTFYHPHLPERNDVHFGMSDAAVAFYIDYHARVTYDVIEQTVLVSPQVAELALARVQAYGAVAKAHCADSITDILRDLPGFEDAPNSMFPKKVMKWFGELSGVTTQFHSDDSPDDNGRLVNAPILLLN
ncbi:hypothetical protein [Pacificibacter marinus]|uniref:Lipoprotein n=1 Tax=Pacificibacter marinus TaxID=658057 RepID=A0A1Y5TGY9_9RHOB|nr:hypothetical protein [Pacificibacter marinus]SEL18059.1 hypothetical protein SAMN04488032_11366 [Pacificibacter marinus]SLN63552.1 hypothetical protein PAM7971_03302 [Pacificibacter marinus]